MQIRLRHPYLWLGLLFVLCVVQEVQFPVILLSRVARVTEVARPPFVLRPEAPIIERVQSEARAAGLKPGERVLAVGGRPLVGRAVLNEVLAGLKPGAKLAVTVRDAASGESTVEVVATAARSHPFSFWEWLISIVLACALPLFCVALGFWVAAIRPRDPLAWLLLALMLSFAQNTTPLEFFKWQRVLRAVGVAYHAILGGSWPIWLFLFGLYFPEPLPLDRRLPWLKWVLLVPLILLTLAGVVVTAGSVEYYPLAEAVSSALPGFSEWFRVLAVIAVVCFFAVTAAKAWTSDHRDTRRRMRLLYFGSTLSFAPLFVLAVRSLVRGGADLFEGVPLPIVIGSLLFLCLFPLTLAYVIVVERAMDVQVAVRQGIKYAVAQSGVAALRVGLTATGVALVIWLVQQPQVSWVLDAVIVAAGVAVTIALRRILARLSAWTDRRFFREAYQSEHILSELSDQVRTIVETRPLVETVTDRITDSLHISRVMAFLKMNGSYRAARAVGFEREPEVWFAENSEVVGRLRQVRAPWRVHRNRPDAWLSQIHESDRKILEGLESELLLPLSARGNLLGFLSLGPKKSEEPYTRTDLQLLETVATQTALALENSRLTAAIATDAAQRERFKREIEIAREVQERLFPQRLPEIAGLDYAGYCRPALGVGGDYYDFLPLNDGKLGIAIGDVSGKGIAAALLMASLQASLRAQAMGGPEELDRQMANVNRLIYDASASNRYATFFYAQYDPAKRSLRYVNAGHNDPMIFRRSSQQVLRLDVGGPVVGLLSAITYREGCVQFEPGDVLLAFTDGISEAMNPVDEEWGETPMMETARLRLDGSAQELIDTLIAGADHFAAGAPQHDDMTVVVVRVL